MSNDSQTTLSASKERLALTGTLTCSAAVALTVFYALTANSVALIADLFNTILEFISVLISWLTLRAVRQNRIFLFNYGYGKLEALSSFIVALFMLAGVMTVSWLTIHRFQNPVQLQGIGLWMGAGCHLVFGGINGSLFWKSFQLARQSPSPMSKAQCRVFVVKTTSNLCMLTTLVLNLALAERSWVHYLDPCASAIILGTMLANAGIILKHSVRELIDRTLDESMQLLIDRSLVKFYDQYTELGGVKSRYSGERLYIELFLKFNPTATIAEVEKTALGISAEIERDIPGSRVLVVPFNSFLNSSL